MNKDNKKIGIITFHRAVNYGACLQAYALKKFLLKQGVQADIIDYRSSDVEELYFKPIHSGLSLKTIIKNIITWQIQNKRNKLFGRFLRENILNDGQKSIITEKDLQSLNQEYDIFISGSDQVWSPLCTADDRTFMLDFVEDKNKKYSYAASFGVVNDSYLHNNEIIELLRDYKAISVREKKGIDIIKEMLGKDIFAEQHVDPTFLLDQEEWKKMTHAVNEDKYVFVYSLSMPQETIEFAEKVALDKNLKIKCFTLNNLYTMLNPGKVINGSPIDFLSYIYNAEYVVTNSFHGTAFSIIFNKQFWVVKNKNPKHDNSRLVNILSLLGLEDRICDDTNIPQLDSFIKYDDVNRKINILKDESEKYLKDIANKN